MKELDTENGIGLIEKKRRGLGKPYIIYVKNFSTITDAKTEEKSDNADKTTEVQKLNLKNSVRAVMSEILVAAFLCFWTRCPEAGRRNI